MEGGEKIPSTGSGAGGVALRLFTVAAVAAISVWANYEASKGFDISVSNEIADAAAARRFELLFLADDRINRMVLSSSRVAQRLLYGENAQDRKKVVKRVSITVRISTSHHPRSSLVAGDARNCAEQCYSYAIYLGSAILGEKADVGMARRVVGEAVQKVMSYVWLYDGHGRAPAALLDGIAEYVTRASVGGVNVARVSIGEGDGRPGETTISGRGSRTERSRECWLAEEPGEVAAFIGYCECMSSGFVARLNGKMAEGWWPEMVDEALGKSSMWFCSSFSSVLALASQSMGETCLSWRTWTQ